MRMDLRRLLTEENVGGFDLALRALVGSLAIVALAMNLAVGVWAYVAAFLALTGLYTGMMRHCTPYVLLGFSTARR